MSERVPEQPPGWSAPGSRDGGRDGHAPPQYAPPQYGPPQYPPPQYPPPQYAPAGYAAPPGWGGPAAGAPRPGVVPLRPLGLGELLDGAVAVVRRYPRPTLGLSLAVALMSTALGVLLVLLLPGAVFAGATAGSDPSASEAQLGALAAGGLAAAVVQGLAGLVLSGLITIVVGRAVLGQPMTSRQAWAALRPRLGRLVLLAFVIGLLVVGVVALAVAIAAGASAAAGAAGLVLGVPLVLASVVAAGYVYFRLSLAAPALVLEKLGVREALRRSGVLVHRSFWRVLGVLLLTAVIAGVVAAILRVPFAAVGGGGVLTGAGTGTAALVLTQIASGLAQTLTAPFSSGVRALLYVDRRMRSEGLDLVLAAAAAAPAPPPS